MHLLIPGQTPAQKNGKSVGRTKSGRTFVASSKAVKEWQQDSLKLLNITYAGWKVRVGRIRIDYMFYVKDNRPRDIDNMIASVNDLLQVVNADYATNFRGKVKPVKGSGLIEGDHWQALKIGTADAAIDKDNPRCEVFIEPINA